MQKLLILWIMQCLQFNPRVCGRETESEAEVLPYYYRSMLGVDDEMGAQLKRHETSNLPPFWANRGRRDRGSNEEFGPFWANRGKKTGDEISRMRPVRTQGDVELQRSMRARAACLACQTMFTRASNVPSQETRLQEPLYVEEPHWILVRRDEDRRSNGQPTRQPDPNGPFFVTRGKKHSATDIQQPPPTYIGRYE